VFDEAALKKENAQLRKELEETKNRLKESNDKLTRIDNDMARLCTLMDAFGEMLNDQFIVHCVSRKHKDFIYETVFKYSNLKN
jgi:phosphopantetheine adenylyltransferase